MKWQEGPLLCWCPRARALVVRKVRPFRVPDFQALPVGGLVNRILVPRGTARPVL